MGKENPWGSLNSGTTMFSPTNQFSFSPQINNDYNSIGTNMSHSYSDIPNLNREGMSFSDYSNLAKNTSFGDGKMKYMFKAGSAWADSDAGKNVMGKVGAGIAGASAIAEATLANSRVLNKDKYSNEIKSFANNARLDANNASYNYGGSNNNILSQVANNSINKINAMGNVSLSNLRPSKASQWGNVGKAAIAGFTSGAKMGGGLGAIIGTGVGILSSSLGSIFGRKKAKKQRDEFNRQIANANAVANHSFAVNNAVNSSNLNNAINNNNMESSLNSQAKLFALGGNISPNDFNLANTMMNNNLMSSYNKTAFDMPTNLYAVGGEMPMQQGGGISEVNNGGTHEQNPYEGVPIGIDANGMPNLVEEGEVIWRGADDNRVNKSLMDKGNVGNTDYVFSNRLKPSQTLLNEVNIPIKQSKSKDDKDKKSYADLAKEVNKELKERPNDPIAKNTVNANLSKLRDAQEDDRARMEMEQARKILASGMAGMMGNGMNTAPNVNDMQNNVPEQIPQEQTMMQQPNDLSMYNRSGNEMLGQQMACGGAIKHGYGDPIFRPILQNNNYSNMGTGNYSVGTDGYGFSTNPQVMLSNYENQQSNIPLMAKEPTKWNYRPTLLIEPDGTMRQKTREDWLYGSQYYNNWRQSHPEVFATTPTQTAQPITTPSTSTPIAQNTYLQNMAVNGAPTMFTKYGLEGNGVWDNILTLPDGMKSFGVSNRYSVSKPISFQKVGGLTEPNQGVAKSNITNKPEVEDVEFVEKDNKKPQQDRGDNEETMGIDFRPKQTFTRYAPVIGGAVNVLEDMTGKNDPDKSLVNQLDAEARKGNYMPISPDPIGDYLTYVPFDINYGTNKLNATTEASRRNINNATNGMAVRALAHNAVNDYTSMIGSGELQRQAYEYNLGQRKTVGEFNKDTNKFNSTQNLEAQRANQQALASLKQYNLTGLGEAARLNYQMDMDNLSRKQANMTSLLNNLGEVGRDNLNYNMAMSNPALYYGMDTNGNINYKFNGKGSRYETDLQKKQRIDKEYQAYKDKFANSKKDSSKFLEKEAWMKKKGYLANGGVIKRSKTDSYLNNYALNL